MQGPNEYGCSECSYKRKFKHNLKWHQIIHLESQPKSSTQIKPSTTRPTCTATPTINSAENNKLEDLKILRRSPNLFYNVKIGQGQLWLIIKHILFYHICLDRYGEVQMSGIG